MSTKRDSKRPGTSAEGDEASEVHESSVLGSDDEMVEILDALGPVSDKSERIVRLMPMHAAPGSNITRQAGRPRKIERRPQQTDLDYHQQIAQEKAEFVAEDPVVKAIQSFSDSADILRRVKEEVARETAALHFQRIENEKYGRDTAQISTRRIDALSKIASIELEIKRMGADTVNLKSEKIQRVFKYIIAAFREGCVTTGMSPEQIDLLFNTLSTSLEGWEEKAAELVR